MLKGEGWDREKKCKSGQVLIASMAAVEGLMILFFCTQNTAH